MFNTFITFILFFVSSYTSASTCNLEEMKWVGMPFDKSGKFQPDCKPQILYSWLDSPNTINQSDSKWPFRRKRAIFFHRTPLATSIYGSFSYRVKLKANVRYKLVPWNTAHYKCLYPEKEKLNTVYVNQDKNGFSEYVLCSHGPVESWSFGVNEHLSEMKREFNLIKRLGALNVDGFLNSNTQKYSCSDCFQRYTINDARNDGSESTILKSIDLMKHFTDSDQGRVYNLIKNRSYTTGSGVEEHFKTNLKLPFHK